MKQVTLVTMLFGTIIFVVSLGAWLYASERGIPTEIIWVVAIPVITALFVGESLAATSRNTLKAVEQTNGALEARVESAVARTLGNRDAARTRQSMGDIGPVEVVLPEAEAVETHDDK